MQKVIIRKNDDTGSIEWTESLDDISVNFPRESIKDLLSKFLETKRTYRIPQSQTIDDYKEVQVRPIDGLDYMDLALSELYAETGVRIIEWQEE